MRTCITIMVVVLLGSCTTSTNEASIAVTVLADRTDTIIPSPKAGMPKQYIVQQGFENASVLFRFQNIGNTDYNSTYKAELGGHSVFDNELIEQAKRRKFFAKVDSLIEQENNRSYHYNSSSIIAPLVRQLETVQQEPVDHKVVILYSDLGEISDVFNILLYKDRDKTLTDPVAAAQDIREHIDIPDLGGVTLHIVNFPKTPEQNRMFRGMYNVLVEVFRGSHLTMHVGLDQELKL